MQLVVAADRPAAERRLEPQVSAELVLTDVGEERVLLISHGERNGGAGRGSGDQQRYQGRRSRGR